jgi:isoamylase
LVLRRAARLPDGRVPMLTLMLNPTGADRGFALPPPDRPTRLLLDTAEPEAAERDLPSLDDVPVRAHSVVLLLSEATESER